MARRNRTSTRTEAKESGTPEAHEDEHAHQGSDATADGVASSPAEGRPALHQPSSEARIVHEVQAGRDVLRVVRDGGRVYISGLGARPVEVTSEAMAIATVDRIAKARGGKP